MAERAFLIWGGGGHGRVVADLVRACGHRLCGYVDCDPAKLGQVVEPGGGRVVAGEEELREAIRAGGVLPAGADAVAFGVGDNPLRREWLALLGEERVPALVHPSAIVSPSARIGAGSVVLPRVVLNAAARIGAAVIVNTAVVVEHDCDVSDGCHLSPGAVLCGGVRVGEESWVGAGTVIIPGVQVGPGALIGAGAVVIRDVEAAETVVGNPAIALKIPR